MAEIRKYFEDDTLANDWFEKVMHRLAWKMFDSQEDWIYMSGELGKGRNPMIKSEEEFNLAFNIAWADAIGWLKGFAYDELLRLYIEDDIDLPRGMADEYNIIMGYEPGDDGYVEGVDEQCGLILLDFSQPYYGQDLVPCGAG